MVYTDQFEAFYKKYPKTGEKMLGSQRYAKLSQADRATIEKDCLLRYAGIEKQFVPNIARYILRRYWEEPLPTLDNGSVEKPAREPVFCSKCGEREVKIAGNINLCEICYVPPSNHVLERQREYYRDNLKPYLCETKKGYTARLIRIAKKTGLI